MARDRASRPEARSLRLFVAVEIPEHVRAEVEKAVAPAMRPGVVTGARWVVPENWHVTVKFLGSVYPRLREWVERETAAAAAESAPFDTQVEGIGAFPSVRRARVLWAGLSDATGSFARLADAVETHLEREFPREKRGFTAHLTLARFREQVPLDPSIAETPVRSDPFRVEALTLFRSHLGRPHARYEPLRRFPLGGAPSDATA